MSPYKYGAYDSDKDNYHRLISQEIVRSDCTYHPGALLCPKCSKNEIMLIETIHFTIMVDAAGPAFRPVLTLMDTGAASIYWKASEVVSAAGFTNEWFFCRYSIDSLANHIFVSQNIPSIVLKNNWQWLIQGFDTVHPPTVTEFNCYLRRLTLDSR
jgi:hypothetical protein